LDTPEVHPKGEVQGCAESQFSRIAELDVTIVTP